MAHPGIRRFLSFCRSQGRSTRADQFLTNDLPQARHVQRVIHPDDMYRVVRVYAIPQMHRPLKDVQFSDHGPRPPCRFERWTVSVPGTRVSSCCAQVPQPANCFHPSLGGLGLPPTRGRANRPEFSSIGSPCPMAPARFASFSQWQWRKRTELQPDDRTVPSRPLIRRAPFYFDRSSIGCESSNTVQDI